jgi:tRNA threonylcarbamoyladenosine biosynthesis protein TsaB
VIVAFESASTDLSVALHDASGAVGSTAWTSARRQSAELLPRLLALLGEQGRGLDEVRGVAVGTGPGSFTGLRVALALAKGVALARRVPIVGVPSLGAWLDAAPDAAAAVARAGARDAYVLARGEDVARIVDRDELIGLLGTREIVASSEVVEAFGLSDSSTSPSGAAAAIARIAQERLSGSGEGDDLSRLEPIYLRAPRGVPDVQPGAVKWL